MDIRSKSSRKAGIIAVVLLLAFCALSMLRSYPEMSAFLESEESDETMYMEGLYSIGNDLAEGNYILYNEYARETDPGQVLDEFGQRPFDLVRKYMDCAVFAEEDAGGDAETAETSEGSGEQDRELSVLTENLAEDTQELLTAPETDHYAFRAEYRFSGDGMLSGVQVDGTVLSPEDAYNLENNYIRETEIEEDNYGISSISVPAGVTVIYGMTKENLDAYIKATDPMYPDIYSLSSSGAYRDTLEMLGLLVIAAALLLPLVRRLDISGMKMFAVPFEIPVLVLFLCFCSDLYFLPMQVVYGSLTGSLLPTASTGGLELPAMLLNFFMWMLVFGVLFWAVTSLRAIVRMKGAYWRERTLTYRLICRIRNRGDEYGGTMTKKAGGAFRKVKSFISRQYDALLHLDFQDKTNRTILKVVVINFLLLCVVCAFWYYGIFALIVYSVILFLFLRKYTKDLQEKYKMLLKSTNQLADGHLDVPIEGDIGLFNPIQEELKKIQKGFKKAVDEEVKNERMKTELVTNVSHDLRTPLTAIITYTDLLKNEEDEDKRKEYIEVLEKKSLRLKVLIEDLFEISKAASRNIVMHYMKVDIVNLLKEVGLENDGKIRDANLEFRWKLPEQKVVMYLDSQKTYRIFENLIVNITKYAMPHSRVYIEMKDQENSVHISMKNVSAAELDFDVDEITDRFVRGDSSRNTEGSGLGLAIAKSFVELQHGTLKISTEADLFKADIVLPKMDMPEEEMTEHNSSIL
ncbi:two-component sensor histidine kinase [Lachnoclostridium sp. An76]|nr:two-component sensor histidine kinase [Lachnoclostridium sp. An76]